DRAIWPLIDTGVFAKRPEVKLRVYEMLQPVVDLAFLEDVPHVANLSVDCIYTSENAEVLSTLTNLKDLRVG
nr:hypothetical protein [Desulfuromonadales bacterium]